MSKFWFSKLYAAPAKPRLEVVEYLFVYPPTMKSILENLCNFFEPEALFNTIFLCVKCFNGLFKGILFVLLNNKSVFKKTFKMFKKAFFRPLLPFLCVLLSLEMGHPLSTYAKFCEKLTFLSISKLTLRTCAYQGVRNDSFSENFAYVLNG